VQAVADKTVLFNEWMKKSIGQQIFAPIQPFAFLESLLESY